MNKKLLVLFIVITMQKNIILGDHLEDIKNIIILTVGACGVGG